MAEGDSSHYEISVKVGDRWEIHARFTVTQKDAAIEEARSLERNSKAQVKVSRETFDKSSGLYKEIIVYRTPGSMGNVGGGSAYSGGGGGFGGGSSYRGRQDDDDDLDFGFETDDDGFFSPDDDDEPRPRRRKSAGGGRAGGSSGIGRRVGLITMLSLLASGGITWYLAASEEKLESLRRITNLAGHADVLFAVFLVLFVISFLALALVLLSEFMAPPPAKAAKVGGSKAAAPVAAAPQPEDGTASWLKKRKAEGDRLIIAADDTPAEPVPPPPPKKEEPPPPPPPPPEPEPFEEEEEEAPVEEIAAPAVEAPPVQALSADGEAQRRQMASFLKVALDDLGEPVAGLNAFNRFGVNLYLAGAVESLARDKALSREETGQILEDMVADIGTSPDHAARFAESYESYLLNARYMEMFDAGRLAVNSFLEGDRDGARRLQASLVAWNRPKTTEEKTGGTVAVMFTDMVGSTDLNQKVGDVAAQYVVHTHNRIVRSVLADYYGREVKHTGDGIMASFANTSNAVKAGIVIQKRVMANNKAEADLPLHLRIGINVGEPIQENDDLFGVTVQMAARLCAAAKTDQVLVSEGVKALCAGKDIRFEDQGVRELKGISEPVHVFEPIWEPTK